MGGVGALIVVSSIGIATRPHSPRKTCSLSLSLSLSGFSRTPTAPPLAANQSRLFSSESKPSNPLVFLRQLNLAIPFFSQCLPNSPLLPPGRLGLRVLTTIVVWLVSTTLPPSSGQPALVEASTSTKDAS